MKKHLLLMMALTVFCAAHAQWTNNPSNNNFVANTSTDAGEIYISTDDVSGDTYFQWMQFASNGWSPTIQRLNYNGAPQWGFEGIHINGQSFSSYSEGTAMTATHDGGVVSCFSTDEGNCWAVRINADGSFPWGEHGVMLFNGQGGSRTEIMAGDDGGVWALGADYDNTYVQYVNPDGTLNPMVTISDSDKKCVFGLMVPAPNNGVFVVYEKEVWAYTYFYTKEIWVRGFSTNGTAISEDTQLMSEQTMGGSYVHYVVPDGIGGGYAYIWHPGFSDAFNTYVFHFNANGATTIFDLNGVPVHSADPSNFYLDAYATVDPTSHDLLIAYQQTDAAFQTECRLYVNRIDESGNRVWDNGILIHDNGTIPCGGLRIDAFEYEPGFSVIFHKGLNTTGYESTVEAKGFNLNGEPLWNTVMCSTAYPKTGDQNSSGFHLGQNIVAWVNSSTGGLYAQNIGVDGTMGQMTPPTPPTPCPAPRDFDGKYLWEGGDFGVRLGWTAPEDTPLLYHLYRENLDTGTTETIDIDGNSVMYSESVPIGDYIYRITAVHEDCESDPAITVDGQNYLLLQVTSAEEAFAEEIVTVTKIYTMNGQLIRNAKVEELSNGIYIVQGLTSSGKLVSRKVVVD